MQIPAGSTTKRVLQQRGATGTNLQQVEFQTLFWQMEGIWRLAKGEILNAKVQIRQQENEAGDIESPVA